MKYIVESLKPVEEVVRDLETATQRHGYGVLHQHDLKATLDEKGVGLDHECRVLEVCNPQIAKDVLSTDMTMNMALPCRISVWEEDGRTYIGMIRPTALLEVLSNDPSLIDSAMDVERATVRIIEEARTA